MSDTEQINPAKVPANRFGIGLNVVIAAIALFAIVVMVNYLAARHYRRMQWSSKTSARLSPVTTQFLRTLTNTVTITAFYDADPNKAVYSMVSALLKEYELASPLLKVQTINYVRDPGAAKDFKARHDLPQQTDKDLIVFESGSKRRVVFEHELSDYDMSKLIQGESKEVKRIGFKGEMLFTSAILSVTDARTSKAYVLQGHGEHDPASEEEVVGYSKFANLLRQKNIEIEKLILGGTTDIPADCQLLIIPGPRNIFQVSEITKIEKYLSQGGRLFASLNTQSVGYRTGLERIVALYGIKIGNDVVYDPDNVLGQNDIIARDFGGHPIVMPLIGTGLYIPMPRSISKLSGGPTGPEAPKVELLVMTGKRGITKSDIRNNVAYTNPSVDREGNIGLIAAAEKGSIQGVAADRGTTRLVVSGDSYFLGNGTIENAANRDFANLAVNWLLDRNYLLGGIGPRPITDYKINLTNNQLTRVRWLMLAALPGAVILCGLIVWMRRRS